MNSYRNLSFCSEGRDPQNVSLNVTLSRDTLRNRSLLRNITSYMVFNFPCNNQSSFLLQIVFIFVFRRNCDKSNNLNDNLKLLVVTSSVVFITDDGAHLGTGVARKSKIIQINSNDTIGSLVKLISQIKSRYGFDIKWI